MSKHIESINYSNIFLNHRLFENAVCDLGIPEHCILYVCSGEVEFDDNDKTIFVREGECAFIRRDVRLKMHKRSSDESGVYQSILLRFTRNFLHDFYRKLDKKSLPTDAERSKESICKIEVKPDVQSLFDSIKPFFNSDVEPTEQWLNIKMLEGLYTVLNTDKAVYASLFDFADAWKIDLMGFMNENFMYDLSMDEFAKYTGRSLTTFKRDFKKVSDLTPEKWIVTKRLELAHDMIVNQKRKVKEVISDVGFKNLSHFSRIYKEKYGMAPTMSHL